MSWYRSVFFLLAITSLFSQQNRVKSPEEIQEELTEAEKEFEVARNMFNPWYAGPLLTGSPHTVPPGLFNIQPYLFVIDNYATFNSSRNSTDIPDFVQAKVSHVLQAGLNHFMDLTLLIQGVYNSQSSHHVGNITDTKLTLAFALTHEGPYMPAMKFSLTESFPSGRYEDLSPNKAGLDATGSGSYATTFSLNFGKVIWWISDHPMSLRLSLNYTIPAKVSVRNFNAYGGGFETNGKVDVGNFWEIDFGYEWSFTQKWVFALDIVYTYNNSSTFSGNPGFDIGRNPASVGGGSGDNLSFAPAIEYNPKPYLGFLGGAWFSVYGRNSSKFVGGIVTFTYSF